MKRNLLELSREIKGMAETGIRYCQSEFDRERYRRIHEIASEMIAAELPDFRWPLEIGYPTPKIDSRAALIRDDKILLVKEVTNGLWTLPGGWMDADATPSENALREVWEETGYRTRIKKFIALFDKQRHGHPREPEYSYKCLFLCELIDGEQGEISHEITDIGWFLPDDLPPLCPHRASPEYIELAFRYHENPDLPTLCD